MHLKQIEEARKLATPFAHVFTGVDTFPAFVVQYVPDNGVSSAYRAKIALVLATSMTFTTGAAGVTAVGDSQATADGIGTAGVITISGEDYDTCGELMDYINGHPAWRMYLVGARRATLMATILAKTAAFCDVDNGLTFYFDASEGLKSGALAISGEKFVNNGVNGHLKDADSQCENKLLHLAVTCGMTGNGHLRLYSCSQKADGDGLSFAITTATQITKGEANLAEVFHQSTRGERLVIELDAATSFDSIAECQFVGKTAVLSNDRIVDEKNY